MTHQEIAIRVNMARDLLRGIPVAFDDKGEDVAGDLAASARSALHDILILIEDEEAA